MVRTPGPLDLRVVSECALEKIQRPFTTDDDKRSCPLDCMLRNQLVWQTILVSPISFRFFEKN